MANTTTSHGQFGASFTSFPTLKIDPKDVFGSWRSFLSKFSLALKYQVIAAGKTTTNDGTSTTTTDNFTEDMKVLSLLNSVGDEGLRVLESQGVEIEGDLTYDAVLTALKNHYGREESLNLRVHKFVHAYQVSGEDTRDYLRRVEHLSRSIAVFKCGDHVDLGITDPGQITAANKLGDRVREILTLTAVVNGIRDTKLRKELMAKENLKWNALCKIIATRGTADDSSAKLDKPPTQRESLISPENIKQEVAYSRFRGHSPSRFRSNSRSRFRSNSRSRFRSNSRSRYHGDSQARFRSNSRDSRYRDRSWSRERYPSQNRYSRRDFSRDRHSSYDDRNSRYPSRDRKQIRNTSRSPRRDSSYEGCYYCKGTDHRLRNCKKVTCITCGKKGHTAIDCKSENSQKIREVVDDGPRSLRSRSPSPYPGRGREATPTQYVNRISLNKKTIGFTKDA